MYCMNLLLHLSPRNWLLGSCIHWFNMMVVMLAMWQSMVMYWQSCPPCQAEEGGTHLAPVVTRLTMSQPGGGGRVSPGARGRGGRDVHGSGGRRSATRAGFSRGASAGQPRSRVSAATWPLLPQTLNSLVMTSNSWTYHPPHHWWQWL